MKEYIETAKTSLEAINETAKLLNSIIDMWKKGEKLNEFQYYVMLFSFNIGYYNPSKEIEFLNLKDNLRMIKKLMSSEKWLIFRKDFLQSMCIDIEKMKISFNFDIHEYINKDKKILIRSYEEYSKTWKILYIFKKDALKKDMVFLEPSKKSKFKNLYFYYSYEAEGKLSSKISEKIKFIKKFDDLKETKDIDCFKKEILTLKILLNKFKVCSYKLVKEKGTSQYIPDIIEELNRRNNEETQLGNFIKKFIQLNLSILKNSGDEKFIVNILQSAIKINWIKVYTLETIVRTMFESVSITVKNNMKDCEKYNIYDNVIFFVKEKIKNDVCKEKEWKSIYDYLLINIEESIFLKILEEKI